MELRQLKSSDMFLMFKIVRKIGFTEIKDRLTPEKVNDFKAMFAKGNKKADQEHDESMVTFLGFNIIMEVAEIILENIPKCEKEVYEFLASLAGVKPKDIVDLPMPDFANMIVDVLQKEEFKDFFKAVSRLFNQTN